MKPEAWYDADGELPPHAEADALMDFAQDNDIGSTATCWSGTARRRPGSSRTTPATR